MHYIIENSFYLVILISVYLETAFNKSPAIPLKSLFSNTGYGYVARVDNVDIRLYLFHDMLALAISAFISIIYLTLRLQLLSTMVK